jgi:AcrR family transcriptional regulator
MVQDKARGDGKGEMQRRILAAAEELFVRKGFDNVSMRAIASRIGYSPGAIYRYFENKQEILSLLRHEAFGVLLERQAAMPKNEDPEKRLHAQCRLFFDFAMEKPDRFRLMFAQGPSAVSVGGQWADRAHESLERFEGEVAECMAQGCFPGQEARSVVIALWTCMHGLASLSLSGRLAVLGQDVDALAEKVIAFAIR